MERGRKREVNDEREGEGGNGRGMEREEEGRIERKWDMNEKREEERKNVCLIYKGENKIRYC
jgi:hypothetical protein